MPIRNNHWYNTNEGLDYPVDERATALDDNKQRLPSNIIVDLNLRWPEHLGEYAFLSGVSVTPTLVTVAIQAAAGIDASPGFAPLAVLSLPLPIDEGRQYALQAQSQGVGGWIAFGSGITDQVPYNGRFSTPRQGLLTPRAARAYPVLPVTGMGHLTADRLLNGVIRLRAEPPLRLSKETREIEGKLKTCLVVRLIDSASNDGFPVPSAAQQISGFKEESIFRSFAGPCAGRPESRTCGAPEPIEIINAVTPDCDGVITLEFKGCTLVAQIQEPCGIVIDCGLGRTAACLPPLLPDADGKLPSEFTVQTVTPPPPPPPAPGGVSESIIVIGGLPYTECFSDALANDFVVNEGLWAMVDDEASPQQICPEGVSISGVVHYAYTANTAATRNLSNWEGFDVSTLARKTITDLKLMTGPIGAKHNGGLVLNYRAHASISGQFVYYLAEVDYDTQTFRISRFNGVSPQTAVQTDVPNIQLERWYRVTTTTLPGPGPGNVSVTARLQSVEDLSVDVTLGPLVVSNYAPSTGRNGLHSDRAVTRFSFFRVEEFTE